MNKWEGIWTIKHVRQGKVIWEDTIKNLLFNEGQAALLESFFRNQNQPSSFYIRLAYDSLIKSDVLINVQNEPVGNGYAPQEVTADLLGFPTLELNEGDYRIVSKEVTFTANGGSIGPVNVAFLATSSDNSGKLISSVSLKLERTILDGDSVFSQIGVKIRS